jgi:hypothetical protein
MQMAVLLVCLLVLPDSSAYCQAKRASLEELARESTSVVLGKCTAKRSFWNEGRTKIFTEVTIDVEDEVKGSTGSQAVITIPGGRVGNTLYDVSDMPVFVEGEEVIVFLWRHPDGKNLVTGSVQGKMSVVEREDGRGKMVLGAQHLMPQAQRERPEEVPASKGMLLDDFVRSIRQIRDN